MTEVTATPRRRRSGVAECLLGVLVLIGCWLIWLYVDDANDRGAVHLFQYAALTAAGGVVVAALRARTWWLLLLLAFVGSALAWLGLRDPRWFAGVLAAAAVTLGVLAVSSADWRRPAGLAAALLALISVIGVVTIL